MQTLSDATIFGVLYCVKLHNNNLAARKRVKVPPWHRHTYWHKRWRHWLRNPRASVKSARNQAPEPRAWRQRALRECLPEPCFHRKPGQTNPHLQQTQLSAAAAGRPCSSGRCPLEAVKASRCPGPAVTAQGRGDEEWEAPKNETCFLLTLKP